MGRKVQRQSEGAPNRSGRQAAILDAAEEVFASRGVLGATMDEVAHRARLSKGTLYLHVRNKEALHLEVLNRALSELLVRVRGARELSDVGCVERIAGVLLAVVGFAWERPTRLMLIGGRLVRDPRLPAEEPGCERYAATVAALIDELAWTIEQGVATGHIRSDVSVRELAVQVWAATLGVLMVEVGGSVEDETVVGFRLQGMGARFVDVIVDGLTLHDAPGARRSVGV